MPRKKSPICKYTVQIKVKYQHEVVIIKNEIMYSYVIQIMKKMKDYFIMTTLMIEGTIFNKSSQLPNILNNFDIDPFHQNLISLHKLKYNI